MAIITNPLGYQPLVNQEIFEELFYESKTVDFGMATVIPGVSQTVILPKIMIPDSGIRPYTCPDDNNLIAVNVDFTTLTVCNVDLGQSLCKNTLNPVFNSIGIYESTGGIFSYPQEYLDIIISVLVKKIKSDIDRIYWQGDAITPIPGAPYLLVCTGWIPQLIADPYPATTVTAPIALTPANIIGELERLYLKIPSVIRSRVFSERDVYIAVSPLTYANAMIAHGSTLNQNAPALAMMNYTTPGAGTVEILSYLGIPLIATLGLEPFSGTDNIMIVSYMENMIIGTDLVSEFANIMVMDGMNFGKPKLIRIDGGFRIGMAYHERKYITTYGI